MISGPVSLKVIEYEGRQYHIFSDRHNSKEGRCSNNCKDFNNPDGDECIEVPYLIHKLLLESNERREPIDFYIEMPFVHKDPIVLKDIDTTHLDYIDTIQIRFAKALLKSKEQSPYMPYAHVHYTDIRDIFEGEYNEEGLRASSSANPLSSSFIVKLLNNTIASRDINRLIKVIDDSISYMRLMLSYAPDIYEAFLFDVSIIESIKTNNIDLSRKLSKMMRLTSIYDGVRVHRVSKQLRKLPSCISSKIICWANETFNDELLIAKERFEAWKGLLIDLLKIEDWVELEDAYKRIQSMPVMITVIMGSVIMDVYFLARSLYHNDSKVCIAFVGNAHADHYSDFFLRNGGRLVKDIVGSDSERCLVL